LEGLKFIFYAIADVFFFSSSIFAQNHIHSISFEFLQNQMAVGTTGREVIGRYILPTVDYYVQQSQGPNYCVREAACHCMGELVVCVQKEVGFFFAFSSDMFQQLVLIV
jgi:hypothetical protein